MTMHDSAGEAGVSKPIKMFGHMQELAFHFKPGDPVTCLISNRTHKVAGIEVREDVGLYDREVDNLTHRLALWIFDEENQQYYRLGWGAIKTDYSSKLSHDEFIYPSSEKLTEMKKQWEVLKQKICNGTPPNTEEAE